MTNSAQPVTGTIGDVFPNHVCVVMFDHTEPSLPPGGEFSPNMLIPLPA